MAEMHKTRPKESQVMCILLPTSSRPTRTKGRFVSPPRLSNQSKSSRISQGRSLRRGGEPNRGAGGTDTGTVSGVVTHEKCHGQKKETDT